MLLGLSEGGWGEGAKNKKQNCSEQYNCSYITLNIPLRFELRTSSLPTLRSPSAPHTWLLKLMELILCNKGRVAVHSPARGGAEVWGYWRERSGEGMWISI